MPSTVTDTEIKEVMWDVFPFKDTGYREQQESTILNTVKTFLFGKKFAILEAPTGLGKSVVAYTVLRTMHHFDKGLRRDEETGQTRPQYQGPYGLLSVHTRALQLQYQRTFPDVPVLWSGANYPCAVEPTNEEMYWGVGECPKKRCVKYESCEYATALDEFLHADIGVTNYAYYLHAPFLRPFISVIDECHNLEDVLCKWAEVGLGTKHLTEILLRLTRLDLLQSSHADTILRLIRCLIFLNDRKDGWLQELRSLTGEVIVALVPLYKVIDTEMNQLKDTLSDPKSLSNSERTHLQFLERSSRYFRNLIQRLSPIRMLETEWVISTRTDEDNTEGKTYPKVVIKPLYINEISHSRLFRHSHYFLFMSATICGEDVFMKYLGIEKEHAAFFQVSSSFAVEKRPIFAINKGKMTYKNREKILPYFTEFVDYLLETAFPNVRGIIHSISYENAEFVQQHSTQTHRMAFPLSEDLLDILAILEEDDTRVVVSPSVVEGLDLKDDLCRFIIFMKVPYASLGDKWVKARSDKDSTWYARNALIKIIQGSGRGTRSEEDYATTVIMDGKFWDLWKDHRRLFPEWYAGAIQFITKDDQSVNL